MNKEPETLVVEQCDREAACDMLFSEGGIGAVASIRRGEMDAHYWVQAFAAHRLATLSSKGRGEAPEPCSPVAREGESLLASVVAKIEAEIPMPGNDRQMRGTYAQGVFAALQIVRAALAQTPPALSGGGELREALERLRIMSKQKKLSEMDSDQQEWADTEGAYDWFCNEAREIYAALAQSTPAVGEGWRLVPVTPTVDMIAAWYRQKNRGTQDVEAEIDPNAMSDYDAYRAMLAALPLPVVPQGGEL